MARTLLRGLALGGICIAVEAPPARPWPWPPGALRRFTSPVHEPDVHVGVRAARIDAPRGAPLRLDPRHGAVDVAFAGPSGSGKTRSARLARARGAGVLSDGRIAIRAEGARVRAYGTPWLGDAELASADSAALAGVHELCAARSLEARPRAGSAAAVLANALLPTHDPDVLDGALALVARITARVPVARLHLSLDEHVMPFVWRARVSAAGLAAARV